MHAAPTRRAFLSAAGLFVAGGCASPRARRAAAAVDVATRDAERRLAALERTLDGRLGACAIDTAIGVRLVHRGDERFPMCSTFKVVVAAAALDRATREPGLLARTIAYAPGELVAHSPVTGPRAGAGVGEGAGAGMTVAELCAAAIQYSDNTAANLLIRLAGSPAAVTAYARSVGDERFRLDRWETDLNTCLPGDPRDTTTPRAMAETLRRLTLGDDCAPEALTPGALTPDARAQLIDWLRGNTTGDARIRAGLPVDWAVGDKTGTGVHGTANDVAVTWPPGRPPVVIALYTTRRVPDAPPRDDVLAAAARIVADWSAAPLGSHDTRRW